MYYIYVCENEEYIPKITNIVAKQKRITNVTN